jgi:enoyl-CoA hydratase/carnithine racemase
MAREKAAFGLVMAAPDKREGVRAFREKRLPRFGM